MHVQVLYLDVDLRSPVPKDEPRSPAACCAGWPRPSPSGTLAHAQPAAAKPGTCAFPGVHPIISLAQIRRVNMSIISPLLEHSLAWHSEILGDALLMESGGGAEKAGGACRVNSRRNGFIYLFYFRTDLTILINNTFKETIIF